MPFTPHGKHLIAGDWVAGPASFTSSPAHGPAHSFSIGTPELVDAAALLGVPLNLVIVADHGMRATDESRVIQLDTIIDRASYIAVETGPYAAIEPVTGTDDRVDALLLRLEMESHGTRERVSVEQANPLYSQFRSSGGKPLRLAP